MNKKEIRCTLNGQKTTLHAYPMARLLDVLREYNLTGAKEGCGEGECGACSIFLNGVIVNSCLIPAAQAEGSEMTTIEGIASDARTELAAPLHAVQQAFLEHGGAQCGICTPGMIMAAVALFKKNPHPNDAEIREGLAGNLCRCTGYTKIFAAVVKACRT